MTKRSGKARAEVPVTNAADGMETPPVDLFRVGIYPEGSLAHQIACLAEQGRMDPWVAEVMAPRLHDAEELEERLSRVDPILLITPMTE